MTIISAHRMTVDEFLAWEARQDPRYELVDGRPVMMTGGTRAHGGIQANIVSALLRAGAQGCASFSDFKVICGNGNVRYPDVVVDCGRGSPRDLAARQPTVVVEIVSPSSQATDYLRKVRDYAATPSIAVYLIVGQDLVDVSVLRRKGADLVLAASIQDLDATIDLPEIGTALSTVEIYEGVDLAPS